jgi:hypothetical protein
MRIDVELADGQIRNSGDIRLRLPQQRDQHGAMCHDSYLASRRPLSSCSAHRIHCTVRDSVDVLDGGVAWSVSA